MEFSNATLHARVLARHQFISELPGIAIPSLIVLVFGAVVGTFGNILTMITIYTSRNLQRLECIFMANLAFSDLYITAFADPMSIVAKTEGEVFFTNLPGFCRVIASGCTVACINSLGSIALLSLNRYIFICKNGYYEKIFKRKNCIGMCACLYGIGLLLVFLNFAGVGGHSYDRKSLECIWDRMTTYSYTVVFSVTLVWIPVVITGFSYGSIFKTVRHSQSKMRLTKRASYSRELAKTFFIIYAVFTTCWIPYALIIVLDRHDNFPLESNVIVTVWAHLHPSFNWIVYYFTNTKFHAAFNENIHLDIIFRCKRKPVEEETSGSGAVSTSDSTLDGPPHRMHAIKLSTF